jgi:hypothetical protein
MKIIREPIDFSTEDNISSGHPLLCGQEEIYNFLGKIQWASPTDLHGHITLLLLTLLWIASRVCNL